MSNELKTVSKTDNELIVANYMVLFGGKDLDDEHFTKNTNFESSYTATGRLYVDWEHGQDNDKSAPKGDDVLGYVDWSTAKTDERGLWVQRVLNRRNQYMRYIEPLIEAGMVGSSSEAAPGEVQKTKDGEIVRWGLKRDALTVNPAEPRMMTQNVITAIKSLSADFPSLKALLPQDVADIGASATEKEPATVKSNPQEHKTMNVTLTDEQFAEYMKANKTPEPPAEAYEDKVLKAVSGAVEQIVGEIQKNGALKDAGYISPDSESDRQDDEFKSFGDFLVAVRLGNTKRLKSVYGSAKDTEVDPEDRYSKTALAESAGTTGGYLVPTEYGAMLLEQAREFNALRRAGALVQNMTGRVKEVPVIDLETAPSAGNTAYAGGVVAYWMEEAGAFTESEPKFRNIVLTAHKLGALALASSEVREDAAEAIDGLLARSFAKAIGSLEEYGFFRGDGVGKPYGILSSSALKSQTRSAASAVALADVAKLMSGMIPDAWTTGVFFFNPTVIEKLIQLVSSPLSWAENLRQGLPVTLLGRPAIPVGCLPAINTAGDILFVDPTYYLIGDRRMPTIGFSEHYKFANDQDAWKITSRVDGQPIVNSTITLEDGATTVSPFVCLAAG